MSQRLGVYIFDREYGQWDDKEYFEKSDEFHRELERTYHTKFEPSNIGPGFDIPAFVTWITGYPAVLAAILLFLQGKRINENIDGWLQLFARLKPLFRHKAALSRDGAAVVAIEAVSKELNTTPRDIQLLGYSVHYFFGGDVPDNEVPVTIEDAPQELTLGAISHVFSIEADGQKYRVIVKRTETTVTEL